MLLEILEFKNGCPDSTIFLLNLEVVSYRIYPRYFNFNHQKTYDTYQWSVLVLPWRDRSTTAPDLGRTRSPTRDTLRSRSPVPISKIPESSN